MTLRGSNGLIASYVGLARGFALQKNARRGTIPEDDRAVSKTSFDFAVPFEMFGHSRDESP